jgi:hypothetical protein
MDVCLLDHQGEIRRHRNLPASPDPFRKAMAPYRDDLVVAVEGILTWYGLADLCPREGMAFVLGHALSMKAMHGGQAKNDTMDSQQMAGLLRGGMLPQACVSPAARRATRDLLQRRMPRMRQRADLLAHGQQTNSQSNVPAIGKTMASKANRPGVAERLPDPAVPKGLAVDLALIDDSDRRLSALELSSVQTTRQQEAHTRYR